MIFHQVKNNNNLLQCLLKMKEKNLLNLEINLEMKYQMLNKENMKNNYKNY